MGGYSAELGTTHSQSGMRRARTVRLFDLDDLPDVIVLLCCCPVRSCEAELHALRTAWYMLSLGLLLSNTMSLSWVQAGTPVIYDHSRANERVPAIVLGPSQRPGDYLRIQNEVNGKAVIHDDCCTPPPRVMLRLLKR